MFSPENLISRQLRLGRCVSNYIFFSIMVGYIMFKIDMTRSTAALENSMLLVTSWVLGNAL